MLHLGEHLELDRGPYVHDGGNSLRLLGGASHGGCENPVIQRARHRIAGARNFVRMPGTRVCLRKVGDELRYGTSLEPYGELAIGRIILSGDVVTISHI
jgi:hypothetical protein